MSELIFDHGASTPADQARLAEGTPSDDRRATINQSIVRATATRTSLPEKMLDQRFVITISRYSLGTTIVPSSARFIRPISASRSFLKPCWFASSRAAKALSVGP